MYNGNYNLYADCKFVLAFTPGGTIVPTYSFRILQFDIYENVIDQATALESQQVQYGLKADSHGFYTSSCHHVIMSSCHHVIMSSCHHVINDTHVVY